MSVYDLTGHKALVTGGARGLGAGMAAALAQAGAPRYSWFELAQGEPPRADRKPL